MKSELLSPTQTPQLGATHEANIGMPPLRGIPDGVERIQITETMLTSQFPDETPNERREHLKRLKTKFPEGIPEIKGGVDSQEMIMSLLNAFQSEKPFEVTLTSARMRAVETSLALRYGSAAKASKLLEDKQMLFPGYVDQRGQAVPITMTLLATLHQIVTTSPVPAQYRGALIEDGNGQPTVIDPNFLSPEQLVRDFIVNDPDRGDQFVLAQYLPEKLEPFSRAIQRKLLGAPRTYTTKEIEPSRRQVSTYFAMLTLTKGLAGSLSQHDMLELQRTADRMMAGSHDESPVFQLVGLVPQVHAMLASDKIEALAQFYETHFTETKIFHAMRTTGVAVGMQVRLPNGNLAEVSGSLVLGDFMDQLLSSQRQIEQVMQGVTDAGPRASLRGLVGFNLSNEGTVSEEGKLMWQVIADRLGKFDEQHNWVPLKDLIFEGSDPSEMSWEKLASYTHDSVLRTNIPDIEVMMPLTKASLGVYPIEENIVAALYPLYLCAREFSRGLLLDLMMAPDFQGKTGKQVRKLKRWNYDVWTYWQARTGLNELQKTFPYKDFISEKFIPALIEKVKAEEVPNWKTALRAEVVQRGGVWIEAFDHYDSYSKLAKDVIGTVFTNPTLLASRMPEVEGYITALALNTDSTTREQKVEVYKKYLMDDFVSKGQMGDEEFTRRMKEFGDFLDYWKDGGPVRSEFEADRAAKRVPRNFTLEQWLKHKVKNESYASRSQRVGTLRTKEEMEAAYATLTEAEKAVLNMTDAGRRLVRFDGTPNKPGIVESMGVPFAHTEGLAGLGELVKKFHWRNFPINFIPPRLVDGTSVGGYINDFVELTNGTVKLMDGIGERKVQEKVTALPTTTENIDTGQTLGLAEKVSEYILTTYHFVPYPHQRERNMEALKILLWATTPLRQSELVVATMRAIPKGSGEPTHQEMFVPVNLFGQNEQQWLKGNSMRGSGGGGKSGMIFLGDFPARFRMRFGDIRGGIFKDMDDMAKECKQSLTIVGMERPHYNTIPWGKTMVTLGRLLRQGSGMTEKDMNELRRFSENRFDPRHENISETGTQNLDRNLQDMQEVIQPLFDVLQTLLGGK